jgi:hypothetical protein
MTIRPYSSEDYNMIRSWWEVHGSTIMPAQVFLPAIGAVAEVDGQPIAMSFLYCVIGGISIIEFTTTNPMFKLSKDLVRAVKTLYAHLEKMAWDNGSPCILSFVKPNSGEARIMAKTGYQDLQGEPHVTYGKAFSCQCL